MPKDVEGILWLMPGEDNIKVNRDRLLQIIEEFSKWPNIPKYDNISWALDIADSIDELFDELYEQLCTKYHTRKLAISAERHPKTNPQSLYWEVLDVLTSAYMNNVEIKDIPMLKEFLNTPRGKELEAWEKWDAYWAHRQEESKKDVPVPPKEE